MDKNDVLKVKFINITWPNAGLPVELERAIRAEFVLDGEGKMFSKDDMMDIFKAYLQDEFGECPLGLGFIINV